jgi:hypothetical protein
MMRLGFNWLHAATLAVSLSGAAPSLALAQTAPAGPEVDVALVLAVDISFSMDLEELALQRDGYVQAMRSPEVKQAISKGAVGRIAVTFVEWAGLQAQFVVIPWMVIDSAEAAEAFAEKLAEAPTRRGRRTSVSGAIDLGVKMLAESGVMPLKKVIDISGDGPNNEGRPVTEARAEALAKGITINGLPVMLKPPGYFDIGDLDVYYEDCVIGGPGSFVIPIKEKPQFRDAVRTKLVLEIASLTPGPPALVQRAQTKSPRVSCTIGERQWRDRMGN